MGGYGHLGLHEFLRTYPGMAIRPMEGHPLQIRGNLDFEAITSGQESLIVDRFELEISVPEGFPRKLPSVYETAGRIPRQPAYHVNPDGSLCLGSRLRLILQLSAEPTMSGFARRCLIPYLFGISHKLNTGKWPFGELDHGLRGELLDCRELFGVANVEQVKLTLKYLGMKKRHANKLLCPCGCGRRLGACPFNRRIARFRTLCDRTWFRSLS
jgi:hypothetical protein